jgi:hypothetical protein
VTRTRALALLAFALIAVTVPGATAATAAAPPKPMLGERPPAWTTDTTAKFTFTKSGTETVTAFHCLLDDAVLYTPCVPDAVPPEGEQQYADLAEGFHTFHVWAMDADSGTTPDPNSVRTYTWAVDRTAPALTSPADVIAEAASPAGATVTYPLPVATDNLDDAPVVTCLPAPGSLFPIGDPTTVTCTPTDHAGNVGVSVTFSVRVRDTTAPTLNPYPDIVVQQDSPTGASVVFDPWPTATDAVDGVVPMTCSPSGASGSPLFVALADSPLWVSCGAADGAGNVSAPTPLFRVIVNAGPAPPEPTISAHPSALSTSPSAAFEFSTSGDVTTTCRLDGPSSTPSEPCTSSMGYTNLVDGSYVFTVEARDSKIGTISQATYGWEVDTTPPELVRSFSGRGGAGQVTLRWELPADVDYVRVRIARQRLGRHWRPVRDLTTATRFTDRAVENDVRYRYRIQSYDAAGNASTPVYTVERPSRIFAPQYGAVLTRPPLIDWTGVRNATYYNVQIWRNGRKILSRWPWKSSIQLRSTWRYKGRSYTLSAAGYKVYAWPGFGRPAAGRYGPMLGSTSFRIQ